MDGFLLRFYPTLVPSLPEASMYTLCSVNDRGNFIRVIEFNYPFLEWSEDARLTAQHLSEAPGDHLLKMTVCSVFRAWVFMLLLQIYRDSAPFPTAKLTSNPAVFWAWIPGRKILTIKSHKSLYFDHFPHLSCFCHLLFYSYIWPGQCIAFFNHWVLCLSESFFKVGLASLRGK